MKCLFYICLVVLLSHVPAEGRIIRSTDHQAVQTLNRDAVGENQLDSSIKGYRILSKNKDALLYGEKGHRDNVVLVEESAVGVGGLRLNAQDARKVPEITLEENAEALREEVKQLKRQKEILEEENEDKAERSSKLRIEPDREQQELDQQLDDQLEEQFEQEYQQELDDLREEQQQEQQEQQNDEEWQSEDDQQEEDEPDWRREHRGKEDRANQNFDY